MAVRFLRLIGLCILLVGVYHFVAIAFMTPLGRSQLLFTYIVFGIVLSIVGARLLRGELTDLFQPSRYNVVVALVTFVIMSYYLSWIFGKGLWRLSIDHSPVSFPTTRTLVGVSFLITFAVASCVWVAHTVVLLSASLRRQFHPTLLSHLAALLLLLPSLRIGSQLPFIRRAFFVGQPTTSNHPLQPTAGRREVSLFVIKQLSTLAKLAPASGG